MTQNYKRGLIVLKYCNIILVRHLLFVTGKNIGTFLGETVDKLKISITLLRRRSSLNSFSHSLSCNSMRHYGGKKVRVDMRVPKQLSALKMESAGRVQIPAEAVTFLSPGGRHEAISFLFLLVRQLKKGAD